MRSKPSKWCETTGTEHVGRLAATNRTVTAMSSGSGRRQEISEGEHYEDESHERKDKPKSSSDGERRIRDDGRRSKGEIKFMKRCLQRFI
jgi:hypothetical protein